MAILLLASVLAGCATQGGDLPRLPPIAAGAPYKLGPGDQVRLIVFGDDRMSGTYRVDDGGALALPLLGPVRVAGLTTDAVSRRVAASLAARKLHQTPSVAAEIVTYRPIFVLGEVNKPGEFPFQPGMTAVTAVAIAGGFTYRAVDDVFSVVRTESDDARRAGGGEAVEGTVGRQDALAPGDVVTVFERRF
jgi:polysaccharide export outer membrane protein